MISDTTIQQILKLSLKDRKENPNYNASLNGNIAEVIIDGIRFADYSAFSFLWEKSYVKSPVRSADGSIGNLNSYATFLTPHLKINFKLMSIDSYRELMNLIYSKNEFLVTCFDVLTGRNTTNRMYFTTEEMPKLWTIARALNGEEWVELLGVEDYTVEMVGTNMSVDKIVINYHTNPPEQADIDDQIIYSEEYAVDSDFVIGANVDLPTIEGYRFSDKWIDKSNQTYLNSQTYRITKASVDESTMSIDFYAQWTPNEYRNLMLNYTIGNQVYDNKNNAITALPFVKGQTIEKIISAANITKLDGGKLMSLPYSDTPFVMEDNIKYTPYIREGWYTTSTIGLNPDGSKTQPLSNASVINFNVDTAIYQIYTPKKYDIEFISNGGTSFNKMQGETAVPYNSFVALPIPYRSGYVFNGWFLDQELTKAFNGTMKPYNIKLYASWKTDD